MGYMNSAERGPSDISYPLSQPSSRRPRVGVFISPFFSFHHFFFSFIFALFAFPGVPSFQDVLKIFKKAKYDLGEILSAFEVFDETVMKVSL